MSARHILLGGSGAILITACLLPLIWPLKNLMFINYAREQLRRQFRSSITERAGWSEESEFIVEPTNKARPNALPPVLGR